MLTYVLLPLDSLGHLLPYSGLNILIKTLNLGQDLLEAAIWEGFPMVTVSLAEWLRPHSRDE